MNDYTYVLLATGFISVITNAFASKIEETKMQLFLLIVKRHTSYGIPNGLLVTPIDLFTKESKPF